MEHPISVTLVHPCMNEEAGVTELGNLSGQQFHTLDWVAKNYGLIHLKLKVNEVNETIYGIRFGTFQGL